MAGTPRDAFTPYASGLRDRPAADGACIRCDALHRASRSAPDSARAARAGAAQELFDEIGGEFLPARLGPAPIGLTDSERVGGHALGDRSPAGRLAPHAVGLREDVLMKGSACRETRRRITAARQRDVRGAERLAASRVRCGRRWSSRRDRCSNTTLDAAPGASCLSSPRSAFRMAACSCGASCRVADKGSVLSRFPRNTPLLGLACQPFDPRPATCTRRRRIDRQRATATWCRLEMLLSRYGSRTSQSSRLVRV